ncbi:MAG: hypothetical protein J6A04_05200 [Clostridia bacterium]|nr:hypothetical protein [Clostridia bacterium]
MTIKHEKKKLLLIMGIVYLSYIVSIINSLPLHTSTDEVGAIISAAILAGRDWSGVIENSGYYGFGYYSLFFWLFRLTDSPIIIYRVIIVITSFLRVLIIPIAYYISKYYLKIQSEKILYLSSVIMPFMYSTSVGVISNEYVLELLVWLIILIVCKIIHYQNNKYKRNFYLCALTLIGFYSLFIHTRALALIIAVLITVSVYILCNQNNKNKAISIILLVGISLSYFISKIIISLYQAHIYGRNSSEIRNAHVEISTQFSINNADTWSVWFHMLLGVIDSEILVTGGLFLICIVTFCLYIFEIYRKKVDEKNIFCNVIFSISVLCMGAVICAFLLSSWFDGMIRLWGREGAGNNYSYKGLTYIRYWNIFMPPFILAAISILHKLNYKKILRITIVIYIILQICFINYILPLIQMNSSAASTFFGLTGYHFRDEVNKSIYYKAIMISFSFFLLIFIIARTKYKWELFILFFVFMFFQQNNKVYLYDNKVKEEMASKVLSSYEKKCDLMEHEMYIDNIYLYNSSQNSDNNWKLNSIAQFYFNGYTLQEKMPERMGAKDIIISDAKNDEIQKRYKNIRCYVLDNNEVWYTYLDLFDM